MTDESCGYSGSDILAYVVGDLGDEAAAAVAEHLGQCEDCREDAVAYTELADALPGCCAEGILRWHRFATPFGTMYLAATDRGLARLSWRQPSPDAFEREIRTRFPGRPIIHDPEALAETERQLREYFSGDRSRFDLPVDLTALSPFERRVLETTRRIPYGQVVPYAELARRIGKPKAARAVGNALGHNPVAIVVPCHRVVRSDGGLGGYTGGVRYKRDLLKIEGRDDLARAS